MATRHAGAIPTATFGRPWLTLPRVVGWGLVAALSGAVAWQVPVSPLAVMRADLLASRGQVREAVEHYDAIAHVNPWPELRARALERSAVLWMVDLQNPLESRLRWQQLVGEASVPASTRALAWEHVGHLLLTSAGRPEEAAGAWRMAYETAPTEPSAGRRLVMSARILTDAGHGEEGHQVWEQVVRRFPAEEAVARVAQAQILLSKGSLSTARKLFKDALDAAPPDWLRAIAEEGRDACEKRLERIQAALALVESKDIPPELKRRLEEANRKPMHEDVGEEPKAAPASSPP